MGWSIDTWSMQSGTLSEQAFLEDVASTVSQDRRMLAAHGGLRGFAVVCAVQYVSLYL